MAEQITISLSEALYQRARELARRRNRPVAAVLAEVLDEALPSGTVEDTAVTREMDAYIAMHSMLREKYPGQHIAIFRGELVDRDEDFSALYKRIDSQYPDDFVWLTKVREEAIPTLHFRSPRLLPIE